MDVVKFSQLEMHSVFKFKSTDNPYHIRIEGQKSGYGKPCPKCGTPSDIWTNAREGIYDVYIHVCPDTEVYI